MDRDIELLTIKQFCRLNGIGRTKTYELINRGDLRPRKIDGKTVISRQEMRRWRVWLFTSHARVRSHAATRAYDISNTSICV